MNYTNNIIALLGVVFVGYLPVKFFNIVFKTANLRDKNFQKRYKTIIYDLRTDNPLRFQFMSVFLFRRILYTMPFVFIAFSPIAQVVSVIVVVTCMLVYLAVIRPYESKLSTILSITNEILLLLLLCTATKSLNPNTSHKLSKVFGNVLISIILFTIFINWVGIIIAGVCGFIAKRRFDKRFNAWRKAQTADEEARQ